MYSPGTIKGQEDNNRKEKNEEGIVDKIHKEEDNRFELAASQTLSILLRARTTETKVPLYH